MKPMPLHRNLLLWLSVVLAAALAAIPAKAPAQAEADQIPAGPTKLLRFADISKDKVVFAYAGDLWTDSREGGAARRLTSHVGDELYPKFSPDGKWIAFTGEYDGNPDVYVVPAEGGEPKRLTFHPSNDIVLGWTPDGKDILFRSDRFQRDETELVIIVTPYIVRPASDKRMAAPTDGYVSPNDAERVIGGAAYRPQLVNQTRSPLARGAPRC